MAIQGVAPVAAPILGGVLVDVIGWRGILGVVAGFTGILVLMVLAWVPETLPADKRSTGGLGALVQGGRHLGRDHVFVRLVALNALVYATLMAYLSAAPFVLKNVLGMSTARYTAVFAAGGLMISVVVGSLNTQVRRFSPARQVRVGLVAQLVIDAIFCLVCVTMWRQEVSSTALLVGVVALFLAHVACLGMSIGNLPALALDRTGRWAGTGSALLGFFQFAAGGLASPLVGLTGEASGVAFGITLLVIVVIANVLALAGLRARGDKERAQAEQEAKRRSRLGCDRLG